MAQNNGQAVLIAGGFSSVKPGDEESVTNDSLDLRNFEKLPARDVPVSVLSPGLSLRQAGTNAAHVRLLVNAADSSELPPILVQEGGGRVIDGLHRLEAAKLRGDHVIKARFLDCTDSEALVLAMKANSSHGLSAHPSASLRQVARETDVSLGTVHDVSARLRRGVSPERNGHRAPADLPTALPTQSSTNGVANNGVAGDVTVASRANGTAPRRRNHIDAPPTGTTVAAKMAGDPTVRYTEGSKQFLRWMTLHATDPDGWRKTVNAIPTHWADVIAPIAEDISKEWSLFAERLADHQRCDIRAVDRVVIGGSVRSWFVHAR